ncbi:MAG: PIN domain-containing protein [Candidatus Electrothrix aestuarii]|uniref:PIN domain-containing protein n=1 Tax=Candidatus Electrothrix aestuarii TaxID=3062594 RepID=A0AAU8LZ94_9BACT|nr:PIN domain-containing protein [Candidatus Electrothrix aestuarii]
MKVIVDTSVWSLALRKNIPQDDLYVNELKELIKESRVQLIGPVRQELLNGIKHENDFNSLKDHLRAFKDLKLETEDYELASEYFNKARRSGIQGSNTDFLICAISTRNNMPILTTDKDFENFQSVLPVTLHEVKK